MLIFNLTIHHLWGRVLAKFQEARAIAYADDGYIKAKLSVALQVFAELKVVFKEDADLELNVGKTTILPAKGVTQQVAFDVAHSIIDGRPALTHLSADLCLELFGLDQLHNYHTPTIIISPHTFQNEGIML